MRYILHVDINAFFASVEELQNPMYIGKPIAVSGHTKRSVISSANYIARKFGVKAAMPVFMAKKLCPSLLILNHHFELYHQYSERFIKLISEQFTNNIEIGSIDECYVDITNLVKSKRQPLDIASAIQNSIKKNIGLNCSIGIANNKFLAKMASDYQKPMGITTMWKQEIVNKLWPQPIEHMLWIGKASAALLKKHNLHTIGDIAKDQNQNLLQQLLDKNWFIHYQHANGMGNDTLDYSQNTPKSIGVSETFLNDTADFLEIKSKLETLTQDAVKRLKYNQQKTKTISVNIKTPNFKQLNRSITLSHYVDEYNDIVTNVMWLFQEHFVQTTVRLVGINLSNLIENINLQITSELFDDYKKSDGHKKSCEAEIIEKINKKFAKDIIDIATEKLR